MLWLIDFRTHWMRSHVRIVANAGDLPRHFDVRFICSDGKSILFDLGRNNRLCELLNNADTN
jgi:hypothetical protein